VARAWKLDLQHGARLDSRADVIFYSASLVGLVLLAPARLAAEWLLFTTIVAAYVTPMVAALCKFGRITSYHTVLDRISLLLLAPALLLWLWFDTIVLLRIAVAVFVLSALEELVMTWKLQEPRDNVPHLFRLFVLNPRRREHAFRR
jgi:cardiolipin synthase